MDLAFCMGGGTPGPAWEADACMHAVLQHILRTLQPHWPRSCADTRLLCFSVTPCVCSLFSQRRGLGRKEEGKGGEGGERRRRRGRDHQDVQPSRLSPSPDGDLPLSPPPISLSSGLYPWVGKFYLKSGMKKKKRRSSLSHGAELFSHRFVCGRL